MKQLDKERIITTSHTRKRITKGNTRTRIKKVKNSIRRIITINKIITDEEAVVVEEIAEMALKTETMERIHSLTITLEAEEEAEVEAEVDVEVSNRMKEEEVNSRFKDKTPIL